MGLLERLDDKVIGPKGQPPTARQRRQGAAGLAILVVVLLVAVLAAPGRSATRVWHLLAVLGVFLIFGRGRRYFSRDRYRDNPPPPPGSDRR
jgi:hypothetical protein